MLHSLQRFCDKLWRTNGREDEVCTLYTVHIRMASTPPCAPPSINDVTKNECLTRDGIIFHLFSSQRWDHIANSVFWRKKKWKIASIRNIHGKKENHVNLGVVTSVLKKTSEDVKKRENLGLKQIERKLYFIVLACSFSTKN